MPTTFQEFFKVGDVGYNIEHVSTPTGQSYYTATPMSSGGRRGVTNTSLSELKRILQTGRDPDGRYQR